MTNRSRTLLLLLIFTAPLSLAACKKDHAGGASAAKGAELGGSSGTAKGGGPFGSWDMAARKAAFQGTHVAPGGSFGRWDAWKVEGTKITVWDGTQETVAELDLQSPCEAGIMEKSADGSTSGTVSHYTIENGTLVTGLGDAGSRKGNTAIACVSNKIVTLDATGTCLEWEQDMFDHTKYTSSPGTCSFGKDGDNDVFKATVNNYETILEVHGDALYTAQIASTHSEPAADWASAKAARDAKH